MKGYRILRIARETGIRLYVYGCLLTSLIAALSDPGYDPRIFVLYGICIAVSLWRSGVYIWLMLLALVLAALNLVHMFPVYWQGSISLTTAAGTLNSIVIDPVALSFAIGFIILSFAKLRRSTVNWLNAGE